MQMSTLSTSRKAHADSRLPQILDHAARLFRTKGFEATSVRDIARAVGMLPGSLYCHFATKEELLAAVYLELQGGKERALELTHSVGALAVSAAVQGAYGARPRPLAPRSTDVEREVHAAWVRKNLKDKALWIQFGVVVAEG